MTPSPQSEPVKEGLVFSAALWEDSDHIVTVNRGKDITPIGMAVSKHEVAIVADWLNENHKSLITKVKEPQ